MPGGRGGGGGEGRDGSVNANNTDEKRGKGRRVEVYCDSGPQLHACAT